MISKKTSEAQRRASKKWDNNNKESLNYAKKRSAARNFLLKYIKKDDVPEFIELLKKLKD